MTVWKAGGNDVGKKGMRISGEKGHDGDTRKRKG